MANHKGAEYVAIVPPPQCAEPSQVTAQPAGSAAWRAKRISVHHLWQLGAGIHFRGLDRLSIIDSAGPDSDG
jgi:hypothetical protein